MEMKPNRIITFDLDGILINSEGLHNEAFFHALDRVGVDLPSNLQSQDGWVGVSTRRDVLGEDFEVLSTSAKLDFFGISNPSTRDLVKKSKDLIFADLIPKIKFNPFLAVDLARLKESGAFIAVVTNGTRPNLELILEMIGLSTQSSINTLSVISPMGIRLQGSANWHLPMHLGLPHNAAGHTPTKPAPDLYKSVAIVLQARLYHRYKLQTSEVLPWYALEDSPSGIQAIRAACQSLQPDLPPIINPILTDYATTQERLRSCAL